MKPMGINSTPFFSYRDLSVKNLDLFEDAFGLNAEFSDVIEMLKLIDPVPRPGLTKKLVRRVRQKS